MSEASEEVVSTALTTVRRAAGLPESFADERIQAIRSFCLGSMQITPSQLAMFLATAHRYDLDPMLGEIWLAEIEGKIVCVTGRNSFVKLASRQKDFAGIQSAVVFEKDEWSAEVDHDGIWRVHHKITGMQRGAIVGAYAQLFLRGKPPVFKHRLYSDYKHLHSKKNWTKNPKDMMEIRVLTAVFRQAFPLSGLFDPSESELEASDVQVIESDAVREKTLSEAERLRARLTDMEEIAEVVSVEDEKVEQPEIEPGDAYEEDIELDKEIAAAEEATDG